jgi:RNA polymerase sigma-70 factor (ECF subfamily)
VELSRAVAVAEEQGPEAGLAIVNRLGRLTEGREAYGRALSLAHDDAERRLLERRLAELGGP